MKENKLLKSALDSLSLAFDKFVIAEKEFTNALTQYESTVQAWAKKAPHAELVTVIKESQNKELKCAAQNELVRRLDKPRSAKKKNIPVKKVKSPEKLNRNNRKK